MSINFEGNARERGVVDGIEWATVNAPIWGAVSGYVRLPEGHPWREIPDHQASDIEVHGGVTYGMDGDGWIGFDTLHAGDSWPDTPHFFDGDIEWTPEMVAAEARRLAQSAADAVKVGVGNE